MTGLENVSRLKLSPETLCVCTPMLHFKLQPSPAALLRFRKMIARIA